MGKKIIKIDDWNWKLKYIFHQYKSSISIDNIDTNKMVVSNIVFFGKNKIKYFIGYKDVEKNRSLWYSFQKWANIGMILIKPNYYFFFIKDEKLLEKYNEIWKNVTHIIKETFDSEPAYNEKYVKTKIKSDNEKIYTNFHNNKIPTEGSQCICLSVILIDSFYRKDYPQALLEECKYNVKKKMSKFFNDDIEISSDDSDREKSDEENSNEKN